ncbi:MAG TPA: bacterial transcriptional activator domain-containing protein [Actinomycetota bacterium]|jgi:DNA-binding SARP family transcriptional activator
MVEAPGSLQPFEHKDAEARLSLLERFQARWHGEAVALPHSVQRLVAFVALRRQPISRTLAAETLWSDGTEQQAAARLRTVVWRLRSLGCPLLRVRHADISLSELVRVDYWEAGAVAARLIDSSDSSASTIAWHDGLESDLLPDWDEDWLLLDRVRFRELRLHALETLCRRLSRLGHSARAVEVGIIAVAADPLRESAHEALLRAYLAEGNKGQAIRQYERCRKLLRHELGLDPSPSIQELVSALH